MHVLAADHSRDHVLILLCAHVKCSTHLLFLLYSHFPLFLFLFLGHGHFHVYRGPNVACYSAGYRKHEGWSVSQIRSFLLAALRGHSATAEPVGQSWQTDYPHLHCVIQSASADAISKVRGRISICDRRYTRRSENHSDPAHWTLEASVSFSGPKDFFHQVRNWMGLKGRGSECPTCGSVIVSQLERKLTRKEHRAFYDSGQVCLCAQSVNHVIVLLGRPYSPHLTSHAIHDYTWTLSFFPDFHFLWPLTVPFELVF